MHVNTRNQQLAYRQRGEGAGRHAADQGQHPQILQLTHSHRPKTNLGGNCALFVYLLLLRSQYYISASLLIVIHDFLDHVDGIVAKVHRSHYGAVDSPLLGSFLDAFCDKVNVTSLNVQYFSSPSLDILLIYRYGVLVAE